LDGKLYFNHNPTWPPLILRGGREKLKRGMKGVKRRRDRTFTFSLYRSLYHCLQKSVTLVRPTGRIGLKTDSEFLSLLDLLQREHVVKHMEYPTYGSFSSLQIYAYERCIEPHIFSKYYLRSNIIYNILSRKYTYLDFKEFGI
jgi:hypothetical protein